LGPWVFHAWAEGERVADFLMFLFCENDGGEFVELLALLEFFKGLPLKNLMRLVLVSEAFGHLLPHAERHYAADYVVLPVILDQVVGQLQGGLVGQTFDQRFEK
jgi:hypothetical protein